MADLDRWIEKGFIYGESFFNFIIFWPRECLSVWLEIVLVRREFFPDMLYYNFQL